MAGGDDVVALGELDPVDPFEGQHLASGARPIDCGNEVIGLGLHAVGKFGGRGSFAAQIELARGPALEGLDHHARAQAGCFAAHALDLGCCPFIGLDGAGEFDFDAGAQDFDRDGAAIGGDGAVDLGDGGGADRCFLDRGEHRLQRVAIAGFDPLADHGEGKRRQRVLQAQQIVRRLFTDQIGARRECLAELDRGGTDCLEGVGIARHFGHARAKAGEAGDTADRLGRVGIALNPAQRAVPRENASPFQEAPEMDCGSCHGALDLPSAVDRDQPAEQRLDLGLGKTGLADHSFELRHIGEAADRFDQVAIAVLVIREQLAELGHQMV